jgi:hypothetical protein
MQAVAQLGLFHPRLRLPLWSALPAAVRREAIDLLALLLEEAQDRRMESRTPAEVSDE